MESFKGKPKFIFDGVTDFLHEQFEEPCFQCRHGCGCKIRHVQTECKQTQVDGLSCEAVECFRYEVGTVFTVPLEIDFVEDTDSRIVRE